MYKDEIIVGNRYGKLDILEELNVPPFSSGQKKRIYKCKCNCGIIFEASKDTIISKQCCTSCITKEKRLSVFLKRLADVDPSVEYISGFINYKNLVVCKCKNCGTIWETSTPDSLVQLSNFSKCPSCRKMERIQSSTSTQEEFEHKVALKNPHLKITSKYTKARNPISFKCLVCSNEQNINRASVLTEVENYCPKCNKKYRYDTKAFKDEISNINPYIEIIGEYISNSEKIQCRCKVCGHIWEPLATNLQRGTGCPECNVTGTSFAEQFLLWSFRKIYGDDAVLHREKSIIGLELDIYIPSIKLAIEPGGWYWHKEQYNKDLSKYSLCKDNDIRCIVIYDQVYSDILNEYPKDDFWFYSLDLGKNYDILKNIVYRISSEVIGVSVFLSDDDWEEILTKAKDQNVKRHEIFLAKFQQRNKHAKDILIKNKYYRNTDSIECECIVCGYGKKGEWVTTGQSLLAGSGCPCCAGNLLKGSEQFVKEVQAINPNIKVIGKYINLKSPIQCCSRKCGHEWMDQPRNLLRGLDCPICNLGRSVNHEQFLERIKMYRPDIEVLGIYKNSKEPIACKCKVCGYGTNHEWMPVPTSLYSKSKCPYCGVKQRWETRKNKYGQKTIRNTNTGEIFYSMESAAASVNRSVSALEQCLYNKRTKTCGGYSWEFEE